MKSNIIGLRKIIWIFSRTIFTASVMGIAWTVVEIIEHFVFSWLRSVWPWMKVKVNIIDTWCIAISEAVNRLRLMVMASILFPRNRLRGTDRQADRQRHTQARIESSILNFFKDFENKKRTNNLDLTHTVTLLIWTHLPGEVWSSNALPELWRTWLLVTVV